MSDLIRFFGLNRRAYFPQFRGGGGSVKKLQLQRVDRIILYFRYRTKDLQNRTGNPKTEPNRRAVAKKTQTEGFGSVSVFASGVTEIFLFLFDYFSR